MSYQDTLTRMRCRGGWAIAFSALALTAGCQTITGSAPPAGAPATILLEAGDLALPTDCTVPAGRPYRVSYVVGTDGRTANPDAVTPSDAPACLQQALHAWIATFRYAPVSDAERVTADWMLVTARRGS
jgi:hypothetical protein